MKTDNAYITKTPRLQTEDGELERRWNGSVRRTLERKEAFHLRSVTTRDSKVDGSAVETLLHDIM